VLKVLLVSPDKNAFSAFSSALADHSDVELLWASSGKGALDIASGATIDLVVTGEELRDMTGLELAGKLLSISFMINCAAVSDLSPEAFHEASEGLGVLAQLPLKPGKEHAEELVQRLKQIKNLSA
jgi:PleD family two-component response regulator